MTLINHLFRYLLISALIVLSACGGGGSGSTGSADTSNGNTNNNNLTVTAGTEIVNSLDISNIKSITIVPQSTAISAIDKIINFLDDHLSIKNAYASLFSQSHPPLMKMVGIDMNRNMQQFNLTTSNVSSGILELTDLGNYLITTSYGVTKNGNACNLVLIKKSNGEIFCFQESIPANYSLSVSNGFYGNLQITPNQSYAYLLVSSSIPNADALNTGSADIYKQSIKLFRFDLTASTPIMDVIGNYDTTNFTAILGFKPLNNGSIVIGRMEPSSSPDALSDGYLRLLEYWSFQRSNSTTTKSVSLVDYIITPAGGSRNLNFNCFLDYGASDDEAIIAMYGSAAGYRSTLWRIPKPSTPTATTTPIRITNEGASRLCWGSYPFYHGGNVYSLWQNQNGNVDLVETAYTGNETASLLYNTGNTQGAWSSTYGKLYRSKDFLIIPKMNYGQADSLIATAIDTNGVITPVNLITVFNETLNLKVVSISTSFSNNILTVTADSSTGNGDRIVNECKYRSISGDFLCTEQSRVNSTSDLATAKFYTVNP